MNIRHFRHTDIDKGKYDQCILNAPNGVIYAMSWYLDTVSPDWQLLATPDYSFVMPLPRKKKFGLPYILQPSMCQQLGIFSPETINREIYWYFIKKIPAVAYCLLQLNSGNLFGQKELRPNYVLDIRPDYPTVQSGYHNNTRTGLKKAARSGLIIDHPTDYTLVLELAAQHSLPYTGQLLDTARKLSLQANENGSLLVRCVRDEATAELQSGVLFFRWKNRFYYLVPVSTPQGKQTGAMRFLIDRFIAEWAGQNHWIDFEGSAIPSIAQFYRNFGAVAEWYPVFRNQTFLLPL
ncbi:MAG: hypothetical protein LBB64_06915 [Dysgonamonadaceae bacterium]|jgi:uncharacterized protein YqiB (DUF1249 family)|nr:hypothetical protein [Dysgonamonadaceae bacterium]